MPARRTTREPNDPEERHLEGRTGRIRARVATTALRFETDNCAFLHCRESIFQTNIVSTRLHLQPAIISPKMQFFAIPLFALLTAGALAVPHVLETRADCGSILPACAGGSIVGQTDCRCSGQAPTCDLWVCPGDAPNVVSSIFSLPFCDSVRFVHFGQRKRLRAD